MLMILLVALMAWCAHPSGQTVRRWLVEAPAAWLDRVGAWRLALIAVAVAAMVAAVHLLDTEGMLAVAYTLGEGVGWFLAFDVATWVEVYVVVWLLGATRMARAAIAQVRLYISQTLQRIARPFARRSPRIHRPPRRPTRPADDDPAPWGLALAA